MSAYRRIVPWLAPVGLPAKEFDAMIFRVTLAMHLPLVGPAKRHWENCYCVTAGWLELYEELRRLRLLRGALLR